ncbi:hypothetical protein BCCGELA001_30780 [Bradyrhizobium sp. CCGE-LA001]|nr:hypothetical protein BCCGELA001_30780 [Bradyrhizobium sp. CCGE-LA001]
MCLHLKRAEWGPSTIRGKPARRIDLWQADALWSAIGIDEATVARELNDIKMALQERRDRVLDNFPHCHGEERL